MTSRLTLYGIASCDSCKKARAWLDEQGTRYRFHDFRKDGLDPDWLRHLMEQAGHEQLINRRGTTWRRLDAAQKTGLTPETAHALILEHPTLIKRPILENGDDLRVGFPFLPSP